MIFCADSRAEENSLEQTVRDATSAISRRVEKAAEKIDVALAGKKYKDVQNESRLNVSQLVTSSEGGKIGQSTDFGVNLRLPNVEKRWQLRFSTYDEEKEQRDLEQRRVRTAPRKREYGAALFFLKKMGRVKTTFQPRLQLKDPLSMNYILRFEPPPLERGIRIETKIELFADSEKGTGEFAALAFITKLTDKLELSFENEEEYRQKDNNFATKHGLTLDYSLNERQGLGWAFIASSENHPEFHLHALNLSTSFGQEIYRDLLKFVVSPFLSFGKGDRFKGRAGISLNIQATF